MKVLLKKPRAPAKIVTVPDRDDCREYKKLIGCEYTSGVYHPTIKDVYILLDDVRKIKGLTPNFWLREYNNDYAVGAAVFLGVGRVFNGEHYESDYVDLSDEQIADIKQWLKKKRLL